MKTVLPLLCMLGLGWCVWSCTSYQSHSEIPEIHFKQLTVEDRLDTMGNIVRTAVLTFSFIDGDGDIGDYTVDPQLPLSQIYYTWYRKLPDNTYEQYQFPGNITTQAAKIPYSSVMDRDEAQNKTLKGTIEMAISTPLTSTGIDTMRVEYYITDRAEHSSNIDQTPGFSIQSLTTTPIEAK